MISYLSCLGDWGNKDTLALVIMLFQVFIVSSLLFPLLTLQSAALYAIRSATNLLTSLVLALRLLFRYLFVLFFVNNHNKKKNIAHSRRRGPKSRTLLLFTAMQRPLSATSVARCCMGLSSKGINAKVCLVLRLNTCRVQDERA